MSTTERKYFNSDLNLAKNLMFPTSNLHFTHIKIDKKSNLKQFNPKKSAKNLRTT